MKLFALVILIAASIQAQTRTVTGSLAATGSVTAAALTNFATAHVQVTGTWSATLQFEGSIDGTTFSSLPALSPLTGAPTTSTTINGQWAVPVSGVNTFRVRASAHSSGTAVVTIRLSSAGFAPQTTYCDSSAAINVAAAATGQLIAPVAGKRALICGVFVSMSLAGTFSITSGTGATCGTGTTTPVPATNLATSIPFLAGSGTGTVLRGTAIGDGICLISATGTTLGFMTYTYSNQ